jgi:RNA polymerase sigma-70 factor (ECF subfamily)
MLEVQTAEKDLVQRLSQSGRSRDMAFSELMDRYQERVYWHIRRLVHYHEDADDVLQNTFVKVFKNIAKFKGDSTLFTWIYRIATNESITHLKKKKRSMAESIDGEAPIFLKADEHFDGDKATLLLKSAIANLPEKQMLVFNMRYYEELSYQEISEVCETSIGSLKASYHHAVKKIEEFLKNNEA